MQRDRKLGVRVRAQARTHYVRGQSDSLPPRITTSELGCVTSMGKVVHESVAERQDSKGNVFYFIVQGVVDQ
jgi:hypothetical protein